MKNRQKGWRTASGSEVGWSEYSEILVKIKSTAKLYAGKWVKVYSITEHEVRVAPPNERTEAASFDRSDIEMIAFDLNDFPSLRAGSGNVLQEDNTIQHWITGETQKIKLREI
tara:strand:+ start:499 stop:837 length:339 start_codon:yes stop_codon:yes gene_type:complete